MKSSLVLGITVLVVAGFLAGVLLQPMIMISQPIQDEDNVIKIIPIVRVYKDGELVYEKIGDPPTDNLAKLFLFTIAPRHNSDGTAFTIPATAFDGTAKSLDPDQYYGVSGGDEHTAWVVAGTGTNPTSLQDYTVTLAGHGEAKVLSMYFDSATNEWVLQVSGVISFSASYNITEVGLTVDVFGTSPGGEIQNPSANPGGNILVFRDLLPSPIQVTNGDSITVQYEIRVKLP